MQVLPAPTYVDIVDAAARLEGVAHRTPVLTSTTANERTGASIYFKCENFQRMGAFKFRGAYNAVSHFDYAQRDAGVVTYSSGNHAQAIALSARLEGIRATIIMPHDAPAAKVAATQGYGGEVIIYAPHMTEVSYSHGELLYEIGYHVRDYFAKQWERFKDYPGGVLAHSTHLKALSPE